MSTQILYVAQCNAVGTQVVASVATRAGVPATLAGPGVFRDEDFLLFWGLRSTSDVTAILLDAVTIKRSIALAMGPSSAATATVQTRQGGIAGITITGQGNDYVRPPIPVLADATGAGAVLGQCALQVLSAAQIYVGNSAYVAPVATAVGGLAPGGVAATFSVTVGAGTITAITCTNATTNGPYAQPPLIVITDGAGAGAAWRARCGVLGPSVIYGGFSAPPLQDVVFAPYTAPTVSFTPYFKAMAPDSAPAAQQAAVKGWMANKISMAINAPVFELAPVIS